MIQDLTIENLLNSDLNIKDATELFNTVGNYDLQCNSGHFYVSKLENKFYTGIDYFRLTHLQKGNLHFPYKCPDLAIEYFELALTEFIQMQKTNLGLLYNETHETKKFIANEIERTNLVVKEQYEYGKALKRMNFKNVREKTIIDVCESYIYFLNNKAIAPQQIETSKPDEVKKELHNQIFKDNAFEFWERLFENFNINETKRTDLRFMYEIMKHKGQIHTTVTVKNITDWINKTYNYDIDKLQFTSINDKSNENRMSIYNLIK